MEKKILYVTESVYDSGYKYYQFFSFNNRKFLYTILFRNGDSLGFDDDHCISIMKEDGTWEAIADKNMVGCKVDISYIGSERNKRSRRDQMVEKFDNFLEAVYG